MLVHMIEQLQYISSLTSSEFRDIPTNSEKQDVFCIRKGQNHGNVFLLLSDGVSLLLCSQGRTFSPQFPPLLDIPLSGSSFLFHTPPLTLVPLGWRQCPLLSFLIWYSFLLPKMFWSAPQSHFSSTSGKTNTWIRGEEKRI